MGSTSVKYQVARAVNHSYLLHLFIHYDVLGQKASVQLLKLEIVKRPKESSLQVFRTVTTHKAKADIQKYSPIHM